MRLTKNSFLSAATFVSVLVAGFSSVSAAESSHIKTYGVNQQTEFDRPYESVAMAKPNAFSLELLGRGVLYSLNYDRTLTENLAVGIGISNSEMNIESTRVSWRVLPVYGNYYFTNSNHRPFFTAGIDFVSAEVDYSNTPSKRHTTLGLETTPEDKRATGTFPIIGAGYEYRGDTGLLFRGSLYRLILPEFDDVILLGLSIGATL